jgi:Acetyl/propionyl-CoA carboxylase, alpha subunit
MEAMKMEITLTAPFAGRVGAVSAAIGAMVEEGQELVVITPDRP